MSKFFISKTDIHSNEIHIKGDDVNHIKRVLRSECGDELLLCDGIEIDYLVRITGFEPDYVRTVIINLKANDTEPPLDVTLFQGIPKSDKMELIIQKSIELGVKRIVPVMTERTVVRFGSSKDAGAKTARWRKIALEAAKQCNRGVVPEVTLPVDFEKALELSKEADLSIIPYEKEKGFTLKHFIRDVAHKGAQESVLKAAVFIGPEGGFTEKEIEKAAFSGIKSVTLGPRILRTETAGIAVLSIIMYEFGDM